MDKLFQPSSVAVVGASRNPSKIGFSILKNIIDSGYSGNLYPVNPNAEEILGLKAYPSLKSIPGDVDTAVIVVPSKYVLDVAREAGEKGVKYLVVITAGFKEVGGEGIKREKELLRVVREYDMNMVGPNCLGVIDTHTPINMTFAQRMARKGHIAFISQSGALVTAVLDWAAQAKIGFSKIVSIGNKADLTELDFIEYFTRDPDTNAVLLYVESIDNGVEFVERASKVTKKKPVIILKGGVTEAGAKAAVSHTGALAGRVAAYEAGFRKAGVIMASSLSELFDYAVALASQPPPRRNGIAVLSNAGGLCILTADILVKKGLSLATFRSDTIEKLKKILPPTAAIYNPVDVVGDSDAVRYLNTLETLLSDDSVDAVLTLLAPTALIDPLDISKGIVELKKKYPNKAILAGFVGGPSYYDAVEYLMDNKIPFYNMPARLATAVLGLVMYKEYLDRPRYKYVSVEDVDRERVKQIINIVRKEGRTVLLESEAKSIAAAYGIPVPKFYLAKSPIDAISAAEYIGYPVVMKIVSPDILHKTDVGGIKAGISSSEEVEDAYEEIIMNVTKYVPRAKIYGILVEKMADKGVETIVGVTKDLQFGHLIMFGSGGIYTELFKDVAFSLIPMAREEVQDLMGRTKIFNILRGYRGMPVSDIKRLEDILLRINQLIIDFPEIVELDINPLRVYEAGRGAIALDIKMVLSKEV